METWKRVFASAGIPEDIATEYGGIFVQNHMRISQLCDLDKPMLKELGVRVVGDVIAILKNAKRIVQDVRDIGHHVHH